MTTANTSAVTSATIGAIVADAKKASKAKEPNYTKEQAAEVIAAYKEAPTKETIEKLAAAMGKTTRSIIAKLSREDVYKKEGYKTKTGEEVVSKSDLVEGIAFILGKDSDSIGDLEKANKTTLQTISNALAEVSAEKQADEVETGTKVQLVEKLAAKMGVDASTLKGLHLADKDSLQALLQYFGDDEAELTRQDGEVSTLDDDAVDGDTLEGFSVKEVASDEQEAA